MLFRSGLARYLAHEQPGYWGLLTSAQLAHFCQEMNATLYTDCKALQAWLRRTYRVAYSLSGLTDLLHRLGFTYKRTTPVPCQADAAAQAGFLDELAVPEAHVARGEAVLYYADAAHPTHHNTRCTRAWCAVGHERPLPTVSGRERVNLNAALNAYAPTQVQLDETACVNAQSTRRLYENALKAFGNCWRPTSTRPASTSCATTPATTKTRSCGPGWPTSPFARCSCRPTRPT